MADTSTVRTLREAAALIAEVSPTGEPFVPTEYATLVELVAVAWRTGYVAALEDQLGGEAA